MEQDQLFKRLWDMSKDGLLSNIKFEESIQSSFMKLDYWTRTRQIIGPIQIEDMWQTLNEDNQFDIYLLMKLSPKTLSINWDAKQEINCLEWRLVFPKHIIDIPASKPMNFGEFLNQTKRLEILDVEKYDIERVCSFLDIVFDFKHHRK